MKRNYNRIFTRGAFYALGAVIGLKIFDSIMSKESSMTWYMINASAFFIAIVIREFFWGKFIPSLDDSNETLSTNDHLKKIYLKRPNQELQDMITDPEIAEEAKIIAQEIISSRLVENEA